MTEMTTSKVFIILSCVVSALSLEPTTEFGDFSNFVGGNTAFSGGNRVDFRNPGVGVSPDGNFFAPGVRVVNSYFPVPVFQENLRSFAQPMLQIEKPPAPTIHDALRFFDDSNVVDRLPKYPFLMGAAEHLRYMMSPKARISVREAADRFRTSPIVRLLSPASRGQRSGGSEALKSKIPSVKPFVENNGKRYEPVFKDFPEIFLTDEGKDTCFAKIKKVFDKSFPKLPELVRDTQPISVPVPRQAFKLPPGKRPNYVSIIDNGIVYTTYKISTSRIPIYVPFERKTMKMVYPAFPIYIPYVKLSVNVPEQNLQYVPFLPFQPDKNRPPSLSCSRSSVLIPIYENPKEFLTVASYNLPALQERSGEST